MILNSCSKEKISIRDIGRCVYLDTNHQLTFKKNMSYRCSKCGKFVKQGYWSNCCNKFVMGNHTSVGRVIKVNNDGTIDIQLTLH